MPFPTDEKTFTTEGTENTEKTAAWKVPVTYHCRMILKLL